MALSLRKARPLKLAEPPSAVYASTKLSSKGQLTVPVAMRRALGTDRVTLRLQGNAITVEPQRSLAGALAEYAQGVPNLKRETEEAWEAHVREKFGRR